MCCSWLCDHDDQTFFAFVRHGHEVHGLTINFSLCVFCLLFLISNFLRHIDHQPEPSFRLASLEACALQKVAIRDPEGQLGLTLSALRRAVSVRRQCALDAGLWMVAGAGVLPGLDCAILDPVWRECLWKSHHGTELLLALAVWTVRRARAVAGRAQDGYEYVERGQWSCT